MCSDLPQEWAKWLPLAEYWYNTTYHSAIKLTPYEVMYGQPPPVHIPYMTGASLVDTVDRSLSQREATLALIKTHLQAAQNRMKQLADRHRSDRDFNVGEWVYLKLQPYRQQSVESRVNQKLVAKYYGPYQVLKKVGKVAYTLQLPVTSKIHPLFMFLN